MPTTYNVSQIIGKTLIASVKINLYRANQIPDGVPFAYVNAGMPVGVVESYIENPVFMWMFYDSNNIPYYAKHAPSYYSVSALQEQGALTTAEIIEQQQEEENSFFPGMDLPSGTDILKWGGILLLAGFVLKKAF